MKKISNPNTKKSQFFRIVGLGFVILPTLLLLCIIIDLFTYLAVPWQYAGFYEFLLLKESVFWIQYTAHCSFFEAKWITRIVWHFSWLFSLLGIMMFNKFGQKSIEKNRETKISIENNEKNSDNLKLSRITFLNSNIIIQFFLLSVGTVVLIIKTNVYIFLIIPLILPQFFLFKIFSRRLIQKSKLRIDYFIIPLLIICLIGSFIFVIIFPKICG